MAAYHRVHDYACCHLQADCLESGISSGPYARLQVWVPLPLLFSVLNKFASKYYKCFCLHSNSFTLLHWVTKDMTKNVMALHLLGHSMWIMNVCDRWRENSCIARNSCVKRHRKRKKSCNRGCRSCRNSFMLPRKQWSVDCFTLWLYSQITVFW